MVSINVTDNVSELGAVVSSLPTRQAYYCIASGAISQTSNPSPINVLVEIEYTIIFSEPKELSQS